MSLDTRLAQMLCARLCHDLGGAIGTLAGTLDLAETGDSELLDLSRETATALRQRLRLFSIAWGGPTHDMGAAELAGLLEGAPAAPRVRFALADLAPGGRLPAPLVPLALNAALLAAEALPRGGTVVVSGDARGLAVQPQGRDAAWPSALLALLSGSAPSLVLEEGPRRVVTPLLAGLAAEAGWTIGLALGGADGAAPLMLEPS